MSEELLECRGCGETVPRGELVQAWLQTALGVTCVPAHKACKDAAAAGHREQPARVIGAPVSKEERLLGRSIT